MGSSSFTKINIILQMSSSTITMWKVLNVYIQGKEHEKNNYKNDKIYVIETIKRGIKKR